MARLFPDNTFVSPQLPVPHKDLVRLVIAEAPGEEEAEFGKPLVGGCGRWFDSMLRQAKIDRQGLTIANCIQCRPPDNIFPGDSDSKKYITPKEADEAVSHCRRNHVEPLLSSRNWLRVDLLGDKPLRIIGGKDGIFKWRGSPFPIDVPGNKQVPGLATLHPAYIMRDQTMFPVAVNDLTKSLEQPPEYYRPFPTLDEVREFRFKRFAFDIEKPKYRELGPNAPVEMVGLSARDCFAMCVPFTGAYIAELKRIFREAEEVVGHNCIQYDLPELRKVDVQVSETCRVYDTMLLQHLVFPDFPHDLEFVGSQFTSKPAWKDNKECLQVYCCRDVDVTWQCFRQLLPMVKRENLLSLYENVQVPLAMICHEMTEVGVKVDPGRIAYVREQLLRELQEEEQWLPDFLRTFEKPVNKRQEAPPGTLGKSGKPVKYILVPSTETVVPWRSPTKKQAYFYGTGEGCLGFEPILDPKSERITTGKIAVNKLFPRLMKQGRPDEARAVKAVGRLNKIDDLISTFATEGMAKRGRIHTNFNPHGTNSGRLSSSEPNLQNIPVSARFLYVPSHEGWKIIDVDFSNIENRITAYLAGDRARLQRYDDPKHSDYKLLASRAFGIPYDQVEKDNDREAPYGKAKAIVLGRNYGLGKQKISNMYDIPLQDVGELIDVWNKEIKQTIVWQNQTAELAKRTGFLTTCFGRKRWFWTSSAYTESLSFLPQSTAADIIFRAMIGLMYERIGWPLEKAQKVTPICKALPWPARLLLQVHDSLVFECPAELVDEVVAVLKEVMSQPWPELNGFYIPISVKVGDSWGEAEDYSPLVTPVATNTLKETSSVN